MDKLNIVNTFTSYVDQLRNTECSQKEKISCFQHIAECILSPALAGHIYYGKHCTTATNVLLMFCEDLDSAVRMSAEENLNRIFRALERTRVGRLLMDLYGEIKRNGNQRSLRICLNLFAYYAPQVKERHVKWYAQRLSPCMQIIGQRKETLLLECLSEFVKNFGRYLQMGLTDSETCQLVEAFIANIASDCAVKRRCSAQNCISLIESSRNKTLMAKHGLNKVIEMLLSAKETHVILGALGFLRILLPLLIRGFNGDCIDDGENPPKKRSRLPYTTMATPDACDIIITSESKQIIEIFDYCLHLLSTSKSSNHSIINASLEVINAILQAIDGRNTSGEGVSTTALCLRQLLSNQQLLHTEFLRRRKSLKNQIFQLKNYEMTSATTTISAPPSAESVSTTKRDGSLLTGKKPQQQQIHHKHAAAAIPQQKDATNKNKDNKNENDENDENELNKQKMSNVAVATGSMDELMESMASTTLQDDSNAFKLDMQKNVNVEMLKQEVEILKETRKSRTTTPTTSPIKTTTCTTIEGMLVTNDVDMDDNDDVVAAAANSDGDDVEAAHVDTTNADDVDDDEAHAVELKLFANAHNQQLKNPKNNQQYIKQKDDDDDDDDHVDFDYRSKNQSVEVTFDDDNDDDDDDFTTLSEINEPQKAFALTTDEPALTATIDVDNLIDAIDATTANTAKKSMKQHEEKQKQSEQHQKQHQQQQQQKPLKEQEKQSMFTVNAVDNVFAVAVADDKSSLQHLSDIDNESFNSIDFEAEITIAGLSSAKANESFAATATAGTSVSGGSCTTNNATNEGTSAATIGTFFNNLLTHPSTESMTKLFRSSTPAGKATPTKITSSDLRKSERSQTQLNSIDRSEQDCISVNSFAAVSTPATDTFSFGSMSSISQQIEMGETEKQSLGKQSSSLNDETLSNTTASVTASTAILLDSQQNTRNTGGDVSSDDDSSAQQLQIERRKRKTSTRKPNVNPFLKESSFMQSVDSAPKLDVNIGSILEQSMIYYAARLISAHFLLAGKPGELQTDVKTRVSIKNLSLSVLAQCVRLSPEILALSLEITVVELQRVNEDDVDNDDYDAKERKASETAECNASSTQTSCSPSHSSSASGSPTQPQSDSSSNIGKDYEHLDAGGDVVEFLRFGKKLQASQYPAPPPLPSRNQQDGSESLLLEIKDDHFGVSTTNHFLNQPLSRSIDSASLVAQRIAPKNKMQPVLSKSEIIDTKRSSKVCESFEDMIPSSPPPPPRPPKRTKSLRKSFSKIGKSIESKTTIKPAVVYPSSRNVREAVDMSTEKPRQLLSDVLLFYSHIDPILRGGVQQIVGNYLQGSCAGLRVDTSVDLNQLLAIMITGLKDEIHTVVIHGLNAFDKAFPLILAKYLATAPRHCCSCCCHYQQRQEQQQLQKGQLLQHQRYEQNQHEKRKQSATKAFENIFDNNSSTNDAPTRTLCSRRTCADPCNAASTACPSKMFTDNDELIASILNGIQLKSKNYNNNDIADDDDNIVSNVYKKQDVDMPDSSYLYKDNFDNNDTHVVDGLNNNRKLLHAKNEQTATAAGLSEDVLTESKEASTPTATAADDVRLFISPKLLLNKLRLCYHNKYWLVQNKYAEVISNLNYAALREFYIEDGDLLTKYEQIFLNELLQLIGDDDFRVREHAAECLCRFIIQNAKQQQITEQQRQQQQEQQKLYENDMRPSSSPSSSSKLWSSTEKTTTTTTSSSSTCPLEAFETNFNLLWDFLDYRIFSCMSLPLRNLFTVNSTIAPPLTATTTTFGEYMNCNSFVAAAVQRQIVQEEKILANILYRMTNRLMELNDKNSLFGLIYTLKLLLKHFNFADYHRAWTEFNFMEICIKFSYYNHATALDLNCQNDLIDVTGKLMAGLMVTSPHSLQQQTIETLLTHVMKILNIYHHIFNKQKPLLFAKAQKTDIFTNAKELAIVQSWGYFGNDYVYIKLYNILKSANDSYKITINQASGSILMALLRTCINTLSLCIELRSHGAGSNKINSIITPMEVSSGAASASASAAASAVYPATVVLKLIEEILQYLTKLINYAAAECIGCLKQLLKYLFVRNYGNRQQEYLTTFIQPYYTARTRPQQRQHRQQEEKRQHDSALVAATKSTPSTSTATSTSAINSRPTTTSKTSTDIYGHNLIAEQPRDWAVFYNLIASGLTLNDWKSEREAECARHIKLFEPLVNNCLTLFLKSNARIQAPILELLSQLLELNVTYSVLDNKNVIFDQIMNNLELIESGISRNSHIIIPPMMKFLVQLTTKSDRKLITIPKVISITNNLLANNGIRETAVLALKSLAYEIFFINVAAAAAETTTTVLLEKQRAAFQSPISCTPMATPEQKRRNQLTPDEEAAVTEALLVTRRELDTQKEVMLGMLEKFIDANECQHVLGLLLLRERSMQQQQQQQHELKDAVSEQQSPSMEGLQDPGAVYAIICRALCEGRVQVNGWCDFFVLNTLFKNCGKLVLADSKDFLSLLQLFITKDVRNFSNLSYATIILENVILKTEEIYLVNHIKLYLKNHHSHSHKAERSRESQQLQLLQQLSQQQIQPDDIPSTSTAAAAAAAYAAAISPTYTAIASDGRTLTNSNVSLTTTTSNTITINEINYFAKVLYEKLDECFAKLNGHTAISAANKSNKITNKNKNFWHERKYCGLVVRFIRVLNRICSCSRLQDALQSVFRLILKESDFLDKYQQLVTVGIGAISAGPMSIAASQPVNTTEGSLLDMTLQLQLELFKLLSVLGLLEPLILLQQLQAQDIRWNVRRTLLREICECYSNGMSWNLQQVEQLFNPAFLNILIADNFAFVCNLCEVDEEFCSLWLSALIDNYAILHRHSIRILARYALYFCTRNCRINCTAKFLTLLSRLHNAVESNRALGQLIERTARNLISSTQHQDKNAIYDSFIRMDEAEGEGEEKESVDMEGSNGGRLQYLLLNDLENLNTKANDLQLEQKIIDEKWMFSQLIKFSAQPDYDPEKLTLILLDIQSEQKLHKIFTTADFDVGRLLESAICCSLQEILTTFRNNCIQFNPHIHYMQSNPLARVACTVLTRRINKELTNATSSIATTTVHHQQEEMLHLTAAVIALMENIKQIEVSALIYIEARFVAKFLREHLLPPEFVVILVRFLDYCCVVTKKWFCLHSGNGSDIDVDQKALRTACLYLRCIDALLQQRLIWLELNQREKVSGAFKKSSTVTTTTKDPPESTVTGFNLTQLQRNRLLCNLLDMLQLASTKTLQNTIFYKIHQPSKRGNIDAEDAYDTYAEGHAKDMLRLSIDIAKHDNSKVGDNNYDDNDDVAAATVLVDFYPTAIFIAKLIETQIDIDEASGRLSSAHIRGKSSGAASIAGSLMGFGGSAGGSATSAVSVAGSAVGVGSVTGIGGVLHADDYFAGIDVKNGAQVPMNLLKSIGISILRTNQFYAYAVTPSELIQQQQQLQQQQLHREQQIVVGSTAFAGSIAEGVNVPYETTSKRAATRAVAATQTLAIGKLPTIPVESLSDVDVLRKFVKRLSIFGFTTRQQFEEYFMTFLLLINKVYDENMVDQQEEFQIKSTCLEAILELLITYKTFPIVGNKLSSFHHTTRWSRINCDSISLKKLHKVQCVVSTSNIFYFANFERHLATSNSNHQDCIIGTKYFQSNQMDLNFIWQQMENFSQPASPNDDGSNVTNNTRTTTTISDQKSKALTLGASAARADVVTKNYQYFTSNSGIDFKSSSQLIFDVMMQIIEQNHILVLPNLVKFCEICESRDQIKWIKDKAFKMQESIPMDDTISHQHIIYLLCKTQAMLIPTLGELQHLTTLIANYLRSSHVFIRNATLAGLLSLLECCRKTNTCIGKLSEELALLRELIVNYINRHGLIDESSIQCSTQHAKLVWTLNFSLIEWTSKFVPNCHLLSNTIIAATTLLRKTSNEEVYLCVLHGLERIIIISSIGGSNNNIVSTMLRHKIEKLALELVKKENERFSIPALKLLLSCMYVGSAKQLESTELSNGIVQDDPEIIAQQTDKVDILLHCIKSSSRNAAWIYGQVLCQIIRDLVPPNEILTKVIKEFLSINQPHCDVIAMIVYQVFRSAIDSSFLEMLQDWLICSLPTFLTLPEQKGVWALSVIFLSASINLHLIKLFPVVLVARKTHKLGQHEIALFVTAAQDFHAKLKAEQKIRFRDAFQKFQQNQIYAKMLHTL